MDIDPIDITKRYLAEVRRLGISVDRAYLFGSFAKGKVWEGSNLDVSSSPTISVQIITTIK